MINDPLLIVCLAIGCGALLGRISIKKVSLGIAGVLLLDLLSLFWWPVYGAESNGLL